MENIRNLELQTSNAYRLLQVAYYQPKAWNSGLNPSSFSSRIWNDALSLVDPKNHGPIRSAIGKIREAYMNSFFNFYTEPSGFQAILSNLDWDNRYSVDIIVLNNGHIIGGFDIKGSYALKAGYESAEKTANRKLRQADFGYPIVTLVEDYSNLGVDSLINTYINEVSNKNPSKHITDIISNLPFRPDNYALVNLINNLRMNSSYETNEFDTYLNLLSWNIESSLTETTMQYLN